MPDAEPGDDDEDGTGDPATGPHGGAAGSVHAPRGEDISDSPAGAPTTADPHDIAPEEITAVLAPGAPPGVAATPMGAESDAATVTVEPEVAATDRDAAMPDDQVEDGWAASADRAAPDLDPPSSAPSPEASATVHAAPLLAVSVGPPTIDDAGSRPAPAGDSNPVDAESVRSALHEVPRPVDSALPGLARPAGPTSLPAASSSAPPADASTSDDAASSSAPPADASVPGEGPPSSRGPGRAFPVDEPGPPSAASAAAVGAETTATEASAVGADASGEASAPVEAPHDDPPTAEAPVAALRAPAPDVAPVTAGRSVNGPVPRGIPPDARSMLDPVVAAADPASYPPARFARDLPRVMAIANQKGGVGKTTTAVNLGAGLAELGYRVLVIDLDPQGNATTGLGINPRNLESSIYDVMMHDVPLDDCIEPTSLRNLFVCPATIDLAGAEIELVPAFSRELKLRRALEPVLEDFDFVVIDCPPSLGLITVNALAAATEVVVPIQCEYYALEGLGQLLRNVKLVQTNLNPRLEVSAIVLTMFDARTKLADQVASEVRNHFGPKVCRNIVPRTVRLSEAPSFGQPIVVFDPTSRGAIAYRELAKEVSGGTPQRVG